MEYMINTYAKINLGLQVKEKLPNGYHTIDTVFQNVSLFDQIKIEPNTSYHLNLYCDLKIPTKENIIYRVWEKFKNSYQKNKGFDIYLKKNIPSQAGMGGGSSNAAGFFQFLLSYFEMELSIEEKIQFTVQLGADIPFFLLGGCARGQGIGEQLTPLPLVHFYFLAIKPKASLSTKEVFTKWEGLHQSYHQENLVAKAIQSGNKDQVISHIHNQLENVSFQQIPYLQVIKEDIEKNGANRAFMTGSGSTMIGIFTDKKRRDKAYCNMKKQYKQIYEFESIPFAWQKE